MEQQPPIAAVANDLDDVTCFRGSKGTVVGRLIFSENGEYMIDCTKMGMDGARIPYNIDLVGDLSSDAKFILLVQKYAAIMELAQVRFYNRFPCIIVNTEGHPDFAARLFLRKIKMELKLPVLALVDSAPCGLEILSAVGCGSNDMSYDSAQATTPDIKWLGIRPSDMDKYKICGLPMTEHDIKTVKDMLEKDFVKNNPGWVEELTLMVKTEQMVEIEALSSLGLQYLSKVYLPRKLEEEGWI